MASCWRCTRDLARMREHRKMRSEKGPICHACFNALQEEAYQVEQARRTPAPKDRQPA